MKQAIIVSLAALSLLACGGDKPEAKSPEPPAATAPVPEPSAVASPAPTTAPTPEPPPPAAKAASISVAAMKFVPAKKGKEKALEVKADGSVVIDGKPAGKIVADHLEDGSGTSTVTVGADGAITGQGMKAGLKFAGDDIVTDDGVKLSVGDDGTLTSTSGTKKPETLGKFEGGGGAKRAAALVALMWTSASSAAKDAPAKGAPAAAGTGAPKDPAAKAAPASVAKPPAKDAPAAPKK